MTPTLERILAATREDVEARKRRLPLHRLVSGGSRPAHRPFAAALARGGRANVIAEFKRRSPSRGAIRADADPAAVARAYEAGGAAALSVLTDGPFFGGSLDDLAAARAATGLPVLRKDFIVDAYQVAESAAAGADAILLIAAALPGRELGALHAAAGEAGLEALVEVHDGAELERARAIGARLVGVNSRDLRTMTVDLGTALALGPAIPAGAVAVAESGIRTADDVSRLRAAGYHAFLVGERLMADPDPAAALRALIGASPASTSGVAVKVCGITSVEDALLAARCGADAIGLVLWPGSPRAVGPEQARAISAALPPGVDRVGVFVDAGAEDVRRAVGEIGLDVVQLHGHEPPEMCRGLGARVWKAVGVGPGFRPEDALRYEGVADGLLLDARADGGGPPGGTGRAFDWSHARAIRARVRYLVLAGGLTAENVGAAVAAVGPHAVDVSSGVESAPGRKSRDAVRAFVSAAKGAR